MRMRLILGALAVLLGASAAHAADPAVPTGEDAYGAAKAAELETKRVRMSLNPTPSASATLIEAEQALSRYLRAAKGANEDARAQLDAALARLDMEIATGARTRP